MANVAGSGLSSMSDSSIRVNPSIEDPSNMICPSSAFSNWFVGTSTFLMMPSMSVNVRRRNRTPSFLQRSRICFLSMCPPRLVVPQILDLTFAHVKASMRGVTTRFVSICTFTVITVHDDREPGAMPMGAGEGARPTGLPMWGSTTGRAVVDFPCSGGPCGRPRLAGGPCESDGGRRQAPPLHQTHVVVDFGGQETARAARPTDKTEPAARRAAGSVL